MVARCLAGVVGSSRVSPFLVVDPLPPLASCSFSNDRSAAAAAAILPSTAAISSCVIWMSGWLFGWLAGWSLFRVDRLHSSNVRG